MTDETSMNDIKTHNAAIVQKDVLQPIAHTKKIRNYLSE